MYFATQIITIPATAGSNELPRTLLRSYEHTGDVFTSARAKPPDTTPRGILSGNGPPAPVVLRTAPERLPPPLRAQLHVPGARRPHSRGQNPGGR